ncbi:hypothetical protein AcW1_005843 [Taiwanofungus camphoratus]|nr:hypothetical protein AcW1_005843 [Antrodia cinnamomea]
MDSPHVPYQAYRSKKHSRNVSNPQASSGGSSPQLRPHSVVGSIGTGYVDNDPLVRPRTGSSADSDKRVGGLSNGIGSIPRPVSMLASLPNGDRPLCAQADQTTSPSFPSSPSSTSSTTKSFENNGTLLPPVTIAALSPTRLTAPNGRSAIHASSHAGPSTLSSPSSSDQLLPAPRKTSTFRHVPLRASNGRHTLPSSPLRPASRHVATESHTSTVSRQLDQPRPSQTSSQIAPNESSPTVAPHDRALPSIPSLDPPAQFSPHSGARTHMVISAPSSVAVVPPQRTSSLGQALQQQVRSPSPLPIPPSDQTPSPGASTTSATSTRVVSRSLAPYSPGFQPRGVCWPRTGEFVDMRRASQDVDRIERTRLERRLEKLINLHFAPEDLKQKEQADERSQRQTKRLSSIFDLDVADLRNKSAGDLWRNVIHSQGGKGDIRAAEQTITPWEDDTSVSQCPLCSTSFHPLTNRKHHCRLCGRIICSLPVKYPQRPQTCSLLFVVDSSTGQIEEVGEGVDYGVRKRTVANSQGGKGRGKNVLPGEDERFLTGVRICRDCRPALLRQQYKQEVNSIPVFFRFYDAFVSLEKEIENALPQFQELMLSLSKEERPTPEASAARKRLLEAFGQYDALAKRMRKLPCPEGSGSSQDRIQAAILTRANLFLQKHMFPLQSLPKPKSSSTANTDAEPEEQLIDPDSEVAHVLQPLLEQEALLESFVEEAKAHRKFEDAKTLKSNLQEIRAEIDRIMVNAEAGMGGASRRQARAREP